MGVREGRRGRLEQSRDFSEEVRLEGGLAVGGGPSSRKAVGKDGREGIAWGGFAKMSYGQVQMGTALRFLL